MITALKSVAPSFAMFGIGVVMAEIPEMPTNTAAGALICGFTLLLGTLVWVVKKQLEIFPETTKTITNTFVVSLEKQADAFAEEREKSRQEAAATLQLVTALVKEIKSDGSTK